MTKPSWQTKNWLCLKTDAGYPWGIEAVSDDCTELQGPWAWDAVDGVKVYCKNDHPIHWERVGDLPQLRLLTPEPVFTPPTELADAWRRYQAGEDVTQAELRELDEARADWREDVLGS